MKKFTPIFFQIFLHLIFDILDIIVNETYLIFIIFDLWTLGLQAEQLGGGHFVYFQSLDLPHTHTHTHTHTPHTHTHTHTHHTHTHTHTPHSYIYL
jgi:hypothetical protein